MARRSRLAATFTQSPQLDPFRQRRDRNKLRIANFITLTGPAGIWGLSGTNSTLLAASEINRRGGILGREIEIVFHDAGRSIEDVVRTASDVVTSDDADIIMGSHISAVRVALRKVVAGRIPYIYTPVYEGGERTPGVMAIGETPRAQSRPAIEWLANAKNAARWYLIGSDYVWPWLSHRAIKKYIAGAGGRVVGEEFVRIGRARSQRAYCADPRRKAGRRSYFADRYRQHRVQPRLCRTGPGVENASSGGRDG